MRVGIGFDVHRLKTGSPLVLGGVNVPFEQGLVGHSDGDVLIHAVIDALLGAAALGDIGVHFPSNDQKYKDAKSLLLMGQVRRLLEGNGWKCSNLDATIVAERPVLGPYLNSMRSNIAGELGISVAQVSVKATTTDGLGVCGEGAGLGAYAVATIEGCS